MRTNLSAALFLAMACSNPPPPSGCGPATCMGCCDPQGVCQLGEAAASCGTSGSECTPCGSGLQCVAGACQVFSGTGGSSATGGNSATGGSAAGGGGHVGGSGGGTSTGSGGGGTVVSTTEQTLISGTRLKAIRLAGPDGSRADVGAYFWDTQLSAYCGAFPSGGDTRCAPLRVVRPYALGYYFADAACTDGRAGTVPDYDLGAIFADAGFPAGAQYFADNDGGYSQLVPVSAYYFNTSTHTCVAVGSLMPGPWFTGGAAVPITTFAPMKIQIDP